MSLVAGGVLLGLRDLEVRGDEQLVALVSGYFSPAQRKTLGAAVAQIIPASGPGDWSAADIGVVDSIDALLSGFDLDPSSGAIYPSGPYRLASTSGPEPGGSPDLSDGSGGPGFYQFQDLSRVKRIGWQNQVEQWQSLYAAGIAGLDSAASGDFSSASAEEQVLILEELDDSGSPFFAALFDHTMEGAYSHPVYGGNQLPSGASPSSFGLDSSSGYAVTWQWLGFGGDVHGTRFSPVEAKWSSNSPWLPTTDPGPGGSSGEGAWNSFGGYAPDEMGVPGPNPPTLPAGKSSIPATKW